MDIKTLYIVVIFGFLLMSILFFTKKNGNRHASKYMGYFLVGILITIIQNLFKELNLDYLFFGLPAGYTIGVSLYFYTQYALGHKRHTLSNNIYIHYLPSLIVLVLTIYINYGYTPLELEQVKELRYNFLLDKSIHTYLFEGMMLHFFVYAIFSLVKLKEYDNLKNNYTAGEIEVNLKWLKQLLFTLLILGTATVIGYIVKAPRGIMVLFPVLCFVVIILIVTKALLHPNIFNEFSFDNLEVELTDIAKKGISNEVDELSEIKSKMDDFFKRQNSFIQKDYSVKKLSEEINVPSYKVSKAINQIEGQNFSNYVNQKRIVEAKKILRDPKCKNLTIDAIGEMVGFNSRVSFISSFKKFEDKTPHAYRNS